MVVGFHRENPNVWFEIVSAYAPDLRDRVIARKLDLALVPIEAAPLGGDLAQRHMAAARRAVVARISYRLNHTKRRVETLAEGGRISHASGSILPYPVSSKCRS